MTKEVFDKYWASQYPDSVPLSYLFKHHYADRWFRIHSLPESKRYAETDLEWTILLSRQNDLCTDLFGVSVPIIIVTGEYNWGESSALHLVQSAEIFKPYPFTLLDDISMATLDTQFEHQPDLKYSPAFAETIWKPQNHDKLLVAIANDEQRAFFVSFDKQITIAPYDGGVDIILKDTETQDFYKQKYKRYLSGREDGF
jgi:hypothetical protein